MEEKKFVDPDEFAQLCFDLNDLHKLEQIAEFARWRVPPVYAEVPFHAEMSKIVLNPWFEHSINALLVLNGFFFAFQTYFFVTDIDQYYRHQTIWLIGEYCFSVIWVSEMSSKIFVLGFKRYISSKANIFDASIITLGLVCKLPCT